MKALSNSIFSRREDIRREEINPAYCLSPNVNVLRVVVCIWRASWGWWILWPYMTSISPLLPATISCQLFWRLVWAPFSGFMETWCFQQPLQLGSLLPSCHSRLESSFSFIPCALPHISAPSLWASEQHFCFPLPFHHRVLSSRELRDKDNFQTELGTKQKAVPAEDWLSGHYSRQQEAWCGQQEGHESDSEGSWWGTQCFLMVPFWSLL